MKSDNMWDQSLRGGQQQRLLNLRKPSPEPRAEQAHKKTRNAPSNVGVRCNCIPDRSKLELLKISIGPILHRCTCPWERVVWPPPQT